MSIDKYKTDGAVVEMAQGDPNHARWISMIREVKHELCAGAAGGLDASTQAAAYYVNFWMRRASSALFQVTFYKPVPTSMFPQMMPCHPIISFLFSVAHGLPCPYA